MISLKESKTQPIEKEMVWAAFKEVKRNKGSAGVDGKTIEKVQSTPRKYLYPVWNRLASGSYYPPAVKQVAIPKSDGSKRLLGIPTVCDRTAQMVIRKELESIVEPHFSKSSYGYRPLRGARQAVEQCKENCMKYDWVIDLDIKGFFDTIDYKLLLKAVRHYTSKKHILMYLERWLQVDVLQEDGTLVKHRGKGTPQGGVSDQSCAS